MSGVLYVRPDRLISRRQGALARLIKRIAVLTAGVEHSDSDHLKVKLQRAKAEQKVLEARTDASYVKPKIHSGKAKRERTESKAQGRSY